MKYKIAGLELDFEPITDQAYKDGKFYKMMESTSSIMVGSCIGNVKIVVDDSGTLLKEQMPLFSLHGYDVYTKEKFKEMQEAFSNYERFPEKIENDLIEFAKTIKHSFDYGQLYFREYDSSVVWIAGDADFDDEEVEAGIATSFEDIIEGFSKIEGVNDVEIECEYQPDDDYKFLGQFGIDNYAESKALEKKKIEEIQKKYKK